MALSADNVILALCRSLAQFDPVINAVPDDVVSIIIDAMRPRVDDPFGDYGLALAVLHETSLAMRQGVSQGGYLTQEREGQLARAYASPATFDAYYSTTSYGARFLGIRDSIVFTPFNRRMGDPMVQAVVGITPATAQPPAAPQPPTQLTATALSGGQMALNWTPSQGASFYYVNRSTISGAEVTISQTNFSTYTDTGLNPGTSYFYEVQAILQTAPSSPNVASNPSNEASAQAIA